MARNLAQKMIAGHPVARRTTSAETVDIAVDRTMTQDSTATPAMLELEARGIGHVRTELSARRVDHIVIQTDEKNRDEHTTGRSSE